MTEHVLREFVCKYCGHKVVVHPDLPPDYTPNVCAPCVEAQGLREKDAQFMRDMIKGLDELCRLLGGAGIEKR